MKYETAGDPIKGIKWSRKTTSKVSNELSKVGIFVSSKTVAKILKNLDYSLRINTKSLQCGIKKDPNKEKDRNEQFLYINKLRDRFSKKGNPIISVDTKKKELIGNFKNNGAKWDKAPHPVNDHDYPSDALGKAVPYGIYDTITNAGMVVVGRSNDTPEFAVDSVEMWWRKIGSKTYSTSDELLILADSGGSNSAKSTVWKSDIQQKLCRRYGIKVTVCHYPSGSSKWNPIEHRLFSEVSKNWAGEPLTSFEKVMKFIRTTKTSTGLTVKSYLTKRKYQKGRKISKDEMSKLNIKPHKCFPKLNYTLHP